MDSGWLLKQGNSILKGWRTRWFWIEPESHCVKYAETPGDKVLGTIALVTVHARASTSSSKPFSMELVTPSRTYYVAAKSEQERNDWLDLFRRGTKAAIDGVPMRIGGTSSNASTPVQRHKAGTHTPGYSSTASSPGINLSRYVVQSDSRESDHEMLSSEESPSKAKSPASSPQYSPAVSRVMDAWEDLKSSREVGMLLVKNETSGQYVQKWIELRGDNLFMYSSRDKARERRNSASSIALTLCQVRVCKSADSESPENETSCSTVSAPCDEKEALPVTIVSRSDQDMAQRMFCVVTSSHTIYFLAQSVEDMKKWLRKFIQVQQLSKQRGRAGSLIEDSEGKQEAANANHANIATHVEFGVVGAKKTLESPKIKPRNRHSVTVITQHQIGELLDGSNGSGSNSGSPFGSPTSSLSSGRSRHSRHRSSPNGRPKTMTLHAGATSVWRNSLTSSQSPDFSKKTRTTVRGSFCFNSLWKEQAPLEESYDGPSIDIADLEVNIQKVIALANLPENNLCADCRDDNPEWAVVNLGIFICLECSGIHRSLGTHISKVRSIDLDRWDDEMIAAMSSMGNVKSNAMYEAQNIQEGSIPGYAAPRSAKERFIKDKYVNKLYTTGGTPVAATRKERESRRISASVSSLIYNEGLLQTSSEHSKSWKERWVILKDNRILIYKDRASPEPLQGVFLASARLETSTQNRINTFELATPNETFYLQAENSSDFFRWMEMIKTAQKYGKAMVPANEDLVLEDVHKTGWLFKQGENIKNWKRRWFVLKDNKLSYYESSSDRVPKGSIALALAMPKEGCHENGTTIRGIPDTLFNCMFELVVRGRIYYVATKSAEESKSWIEAIKKSKKAHEIKIALALATANDHEMLAASSEENASLASSVSFET